MFYLDFTYVFEQTKYFKSMNFAHTRYKQTVPNIKHYTGQFSPDTSPPYPVNFPQFISHRVTSHIILIKLNYIVYNYIIIYIIYLYNYKYINKL